MRRRRRSIVAVVAVAVAVTAGTSTAKADPAAPLRPRPGHATPGATDGPDEPASTVAEPSLGPMMRVDAGATLLVGASIATFAVEACECQELGLLLGSVGGLLYVSSGASSHHEVGRDGAAIASVVLRLGLPVGASLLARSLDGDTWTQVGAAGVGAIGAIVLDWTGLSRGRRSGRTRARPYASPIGRSGVTVGVAGSL